MWLWSMSAADISTTAMRLIPALSLSNSDAQFWQEKKPSLYQANFSKARFKHEKVLRQKRFPFTSPISRLLLSREQDRWPSLSY